MYPGDESFKLGLNYSLPLWYPDLALGPFAFIKRVKVNFFFDYTNFKLSSWQEYAGFRIFSSFLRSTGAELTFDVRAFRLLEVDLGVRYSYLLDAFSGVNPHQFDFLLLSIGI